MKPEETPFFDRERFATLLGRNQKDGIRADPRHAPESAIQAIARAEREDQLADERATDAGDELHRRDARWDKLRLAPEILAHIIGCDVCVWRLDKAEYELEHGPARLSREEIEAINSAVVSVAACRAVATAAEREPGAGAADLLLDARKKARELLAHARDWMAANLQSSEVLALARDLWTAPSVVIQFMGPAAELVAPLLFATPEPTRGPAQLTPSGKTDPFVVLVPEDGSAPVRAPLSKTASGWHVELPAGFDRSKRYRVLLGWRERPTP